MSALPVSSDYQFIQDLKINIRHIHVFAAVMSTGGVIPAAYHLNCAQSTISTLLKKFCMHFNYPLFIREGRCLMPTHEAQVLYIRINFLVSELRELLESDGRFL